MATTINGSAGVITNSGAVYDGLQQGVAVTASGTSINFTGIPSWAKRVTVMFNGVSTNGSSIPIVQIGDSGGIENTGYLGSAHSFTGGLFSSAFTTGFGLGGVNGAAFTRVGHLVITNISGNIWIASGVNTQTDQVESHVTAGSKTLTDVLTQLRITTVNGTDTFDAGSINIMYE